MPYTAWSAYGPYAVTMERINPDRIYDDEQQTARSPRAGAVEAISSCSRPSPIHSGTLPETLESSKAAAPFFSDGGE